MINKMYGAATDHTGASRWAKPGVRIESVQGTVSQQEHSYSNDARYHSSAPSDDDAVPSRQGRHAPRQEQYEQTYHAAMRHYGDESGDFPDGPLPASSRSVGDMHSAGTGRGHLAPAGVVYEAIASPKAFFAEPWWAFLISYRNFRITATTFLYWGACIALHQSATAYVLHRGTVVHPDMATAKPLYDVLHEVLPNTQRYRVIPEIGHVAPVLYLSGLMLYHFDQRSLDCFRTFLWCHGTLMAMRAVSFGSTLLPDSSQQCHTSLFVGSCHDLVFSGHAMIMTLSCMALLHFFPEALPTVLRVVLALNHVFTCIFIVSSRNHYSVDVALAIFITPFVFLSWTRHPTLVSLAAANPARVLALQSKLAAASSPAAVKDSCGGCERRRRTQLASDGYPVMGQDALARLTEHAHAALGLMGLRPRMVMFRTGQATPVYSDDGQDVGFRLGRREEGQYGHRYGQDGDRDRDRGMSYDGDARGRSQGHGRGQASGRRHGRSFGHDSDNDMDGHDDGQYMDDRRGPVPGFVRLQQHLRQRWAAYRDRGRAQHRRDGSERHRDGQGLGGRTAPQPRPSSHGRPRHSPGMDRPRSSSLASVGSTGEPTDEPAPPQASGSNSVANSESPSRASTARREEDNRPGNVHEPTRLSGRIEGGVPLRSPQPQQQQPEMTEVGPHEAGPVPGTAGQQDVTGR